MYSELNKTGMQNEKTYKWVIYKLLRTFVLFRLQMAFRHIKIRNKETLPENGALIFAPNHSSGLMDALLILFSTPTDKAFAARADIFTNKPISRFLRFIKIIPIYRLKDGLSSLPANEETINNSIRYLINGNDFCIFPEGTHRPMHSLLLPLSKGIFHIAIRACSSLGNRKHVYIVPTGIEYIDYFHYRTDVTIRFGEVIDVTKYIETHSEYEQHKLIEELRNVLTQRMKSLITYIPDNEHYNSILELAEIMCKNTDEQGVTTTDTNLTKKEIVENLEILLNRKRDETKQLLKEAEDFAYERTKKHIYRSSLTVSIPAVKVTEEAIKIIFGLPFFIIASISMLPAILITEIIKSYAVKDKALRYSITFISDVVLVPLMLITWGILLFLHAPLALTIILLILLFPAFAFVYDYCSLLRLFISDCRLLISEDIRIKYKSLRSHFNKLMSGL